MLHNEQGPGALPGAAEAPVDRPGGRSQATPLPAEQQHGPAPLTDADVLAFRFALASAHAEGLVSTGRLVAVTMRKRATCEPLTEPDAELAASVAEQAERLRTHALATLRAMRAVIAHAETVSGHAARCGAVRKGGNQ